MLEEIFIEILNSPDGDYVIQAIVLAEMKPHGWQSAVEIEQVAFQVTFRGLLFVFLRSTVDIKVIITNKGKIAKTGNSGIVGEVGVADGEVV